tara:strand:+ start:37 stop:618 length:582 start_codon:yes stop_codon:yes gene_type:complete
MSSSEHLENTIIGKHYKNQRYSFAMWSQSDNKWEVYYHAFVLIEDKFPIICGTYISSNWFNIYLKDEYENKSLHFMVIRHDLNIKYNEINELININNNIIPSIHDIPQSDGIFETDYYVFTKDQQMLLLSTLLQQQSNSSSFKLKSITNNIHTLELSIFLLDYINKQPIQNYSDENNTFLTISNPCIRVVFQQ